MPPTTTAKKRMAKASLPTTRTYHVRATRTSYYEVTAASEEDAITAMIDGEGKEIDTTTEEIRVVPICPDCEEELTDRTTVIRDGQEEPAYCDTCDREVRE